MKKQFSIEAILQMLNNIGMEMTEENVAALRTEFENYVAPPASRVEAKVPAMRILVAKGVPIKTIAHKLHVQNYQVRTALNKRKTVEGDRKWTAEEIKESDYKTMTWPEDEFNDIVAIGRTKDFDYGLLTEFKDLLVTPAVKTMPEAASTPSTTKGKKASTAPVESAMTEVSEEAGV